MSQTNAQALVAGVAQLRAAGVADPARDARRLLAHVLNVEPGRLTLVLPEPFPQSAVAQWTTALEARSAFQPVSQIIGARSFYGRRFVVTPDVLDPRPETEILIERALEQPATRVLDIGTGSGCILVTLLAEWADATGLGTDCSTAALAIAAQNATACGVAERCAFAQTDWAAQVSGPFDLIVSNPPYITGAEMAELSPDVLRWEPREALTPGPDGLESYQKLVPQAAERLSPNGRLLLEIGPSQGAAVQAVCRESGFSSVEVLPDLDGRDRVVAAQTQV